MFYYVSNPFCCVHRKAAFLTMTANVIFKMQGVMAHKHKIWWAFGL